ncbi:General secretion pathway protein D [hydrothermal vent metagenome]|uniref:General secretion pathway protein D n=1 Tax=hydrothermal vent metagenome TaxID=652676 RepID=A0A3B0YSW8_9ZZZZ
MNKQSHWMSGLLALCLFWVAPLFAQTITLNLKDADINALISTVAEVTGKNFIVDPRVKGKVTVISSRAMDNDEVYQVFLSILKVHGFAAVPSGQVIKIVPDVSAKQDSIPNASDAEPGSGDEMVTRVIQVENVASAQLVPILRPLVPQQGHLAAYPTTNVLIISDRARNVARLVSIIRRIDKVSNSEIEVIRLEHASATEVVRVLNAISRGGGAQAKGSPAATRTLVADERTNSVLLGGDRSSRLRLRAIISHLDTPLERGGNTKVIYLKYAKAADLVDTLRGVGKIQGVKAKGKAAAPANIDKQLDIQADEATNALVITAPPALMRSLEAVIRKLDIRRSQVLVDAIIAEVSEKKARELGVQWAFDGTGSNGTPVAGTNFDNTQGIPATALLGSIATGTVPGLSNGLSIGGANITDGGKIKWGAVLQALAADTDANILSTPSITTLDNEEAEIVVGQNVPFVTGSFSNTAGSSGTAGTVNPFQTIQRQDVGITLRVKPQINEGDAIMMEIEQEISSISNSAAASDIITDKRSIKTKVLIQDGQVIVLGGLIEDRVTETVQKVPLLGDLPIIGALFRSNGTNHDKANLMVFIRPIILRDGNATDRYTAGKYNLLRAQQFKLHGDNVPLIPGARMPRLPEFEDFLELPPPFERSGTRQPAGAVTGSDQDG